MINKVKVTKANATDADGSEDVCPDGGAVSADKGYVPAIETIKEKGRRPMVILKNNTKEKNKDKDRRLSGLRPPYERTFSKQEKCVRCKGALKNQATEFLCAVAYNFRRLLVLDAEILKS